MAKQRRGRHEGGLYKRKSDGLWVGNVSLGQDAEGKRIRKDVYGKTKKEAKEKMQQLQQDAMNGLPIKLEKVTVGQHFENWLRAKKGEVKKTTHASYSRIYSKHVKPQFGHLQLRDLCYMKINALYEQMDQKDLSARTVNYVCFILRAGLEDAVKKGLIPNNQAKLAAGRKQEKKEARFLTQEEMKRLLRACEGNRLGDAFILALHTGLRPGELLGLSWGAVNLEGKRLIVRQALHEESGELWLDDVKTHAGRRTISLSDAAIAALERQQQRQLDEFLALPDRWKNENDLVVTNTEGGLLSRTDAGKRYFKPITEKANLINVTMHTLRHTHATALIYQGVDIKTISRRLGHEDVAFTLQVYGHLLPGQDDKAAVAMDEFCNGL